MNKVYEYKVVTLDGSDDYINEQLNRIAILGWRLKFVVVHGGIGTEYVFERYTGNMATS